MKKIYKSWLKRTAHITCNCEYCGNQRYTLTAPIITDRTRDFKFTINTCPVCNFEDLQITQEVKDIPLHLFVLIKDGKKTIKSLL